MKKILIIIMCLLLITGMTACGSTQPQEVSIEGVYSIYTDKETGVNYIVYHGSNKGGICPRYNADGTLYVSEVE